MCPAVLSDICLYFKLCVYLLYMLLFLPIEDIRSSLLPGDLSTDPLPWSGGCGYWYVNLSCWTAFGCHSPALVYELPQLSGTA